MAARQLRARRYFAALLILIAGLYALVFFTGDSRTPQLGLDLQGGTTVTLTARTPNGKAPSQADLELARQIIEQRVNGLGVAEAEVVTEGNSNIVISVPGKNGDKARELGATALLRFRPVLQSAPATPSAAASSSASASGSASASASAAPSSAASSPSAASSSAPASAAPSTSAPAGDSTGITAGTQEQAAAAYTSLTCKAGATGTSNDKPSDYLATCSTDGSTKYLLGPAVLEGTQVTNAAAGTEQTSGAWIVTLDLNGTGSKAWADFTSANVGKAVGITLDGRVISAPTIQGAINGGQTQITGNFTQAEATDLANQLKYGALPLSFTQANAQSVSTELGAEQLRAGLIAGAIGIVLVFVYALVYYRLLGVVLIVSLGVSALLVYASLVLLGRQIGFALSLAGIAGFIVSIGITADSFVVYFERLKDEIREGRTLRSATPRAWVRARRTILSADAVSFLAAAILYLLAIGDVKGFAFTLGLSTVLDLIVVFLFTHPLLTVLSRYRSFGSNRFSGLGRVDHRGRRPAAPGDRGRQLVGAGRTNGSTR